MRGLLIGGALALAALPATGLAHGDKPPEAEKPAESAGGSEAPERTHALAARGAGRFVYRGSGEITVRARGRVTIRTAADAVVTPAAEGFRHTRRSEDGTRNRYAGRGTVTVDCSACRVVVRGRYKLSVDASDANMAIGVAHARGRARAKLDGGRAFRMHRHRVVLARGPLDVDLLGRRAAREEGFRPAERRRDREDRPAEGRGDHPVKPVETAPGKGRDRDRPWRRRGPARWILGGPANGTVAFDEITGRIMIKDLSEAKDLKVSAPDGTSVETRDDGTTVVTGLRDATGVSVTGTAFKLAAKGPEIDGAFLPADGTRATSAVWGRGTFVTPDGEARSRRRRGTYLLLQGAAAPPPETTPESPATPAA